jgi:hypothetical protein
LTKSRASLKIARKKICRDESTITPGRWSDDRSLPAAATVVQDCNVAARYDVGRVGIGSRRSARACYANHGRRHTSSCLGKSTERCPPPPPKSRRSRPSFSLTSPARAGLSRPPAREDFRSSLGEGGRALLPAAQTLSRREFAFLLHARDQQHVKRFEQIAVGCGDVKDSTRTRKHRELRMRDRDCATVCHGHLERSSTANRFTQSVSCH